MRRALAIMLFACLTLRGAASTWGDVVERAFKVTFVSAELVYINGGRAEGLTVGARPAVWSGDAKLAELEVAHLAEHSAACRIMGPGASIRIGDPVRISLERSTSADTVIAPSVSGDSSSRTMPPASSPAAAPRTPSAPAQVSGGIAVLYSDWNDRGDADLDFAQGRVDFDLRVDRLWTPGLSVVVRSTGRQDRWSGASSSRGDNTWESRIATLALDYRAPGSAMGFSAGRINPARLGAIGRLDGASVEYNVSPVWRLGLFGGANSRWQYTDERPELQTYGVYAGFRRGSARRLLIDQTIATVGQYHGRTASREALLAQGRIMRAGRFSISHLLEIDANRGWRRDQAGESISLSSAFAQGQVDLSRAVIATVSYDTRKSFRNYETRDIADSIFDDRVRQGVRAQLDLMLPQGISLSGGVGLRSVAGEAAKTHSYNGAVRKQGLFNARSNVSVTGSRFTSESSSGYNVSASLGQGLGARTWLSLGGGWYRYTLAGPSLRRLNRKVDLSARIALSRALALNGLGQWQDGDDTRGHRFEAGISAQF
ncbi:MAG TPA: hypothetical protein VNN55_10950 [bacterium]|nr:hypothetical protein [bacterium]